MKTTRKIIIFLVVLLLLFGYNFSYVNAVPQPQKRILLLNSYHEGYKWSDDIFNGIKAGLFSDNLNAELKIEYMDTQRVTETSYLEKLKEVYQDKYKTMQFDLIISSDDAAFSFLIDYGEELFPNTPIVFCGVNYFENSMLTGHPLFTGVVEGYDIGATIDLALKMHPDTKNIYCINDNSVTGNAVMKEFIKTKEIYEQKVYFNQLNGKNLEEIENKIQNLPEHSLILFLVFNLDNEGNYYTYKEAISKISARSKIPIYGVWDFHLGFGIVGGKLTSGYYQGNTAAKMAIRVLNGEKPMDIPVVMEQTNHYEFDFLKLKQFSIKTENLPPDSNIINLAKPMKTQILIVNSYNKGLQWTDDIEAGIKSALKEKLDNIEFTYEYMDVKKCSEPVYLQKISEFLEEKYTNKQFDAIISTDDDAFKFLTNNNTIFGNAPVVFCGVNYFEDSMLKDTDVFTGVVESYDLKSTIDVALQLLPATGKIIVINDTTLTGIANKKNLINILPNYFNEVTYEFWEDYNMSDIQDKIKTLQEGNIVLLLSFNRDKSYNSYSYDDSIKLISDGAPVPIFGVWDFYLGKGLLGGMLTSGFIQGETAGNMVRQILNGTKPSEIPVVKNCPNMYMFDYNKMKTFGILMSDLPPDSRVINKLFSFDEFYVKNKGLLLGCFFTISVLTIVSLIVVVLLMKKNISIRQEAEKKERIFAMTDALTGIPNRRAGFELLQRLIEQSNQAGAGLTICFLDINNLKKTNDTFGHQAGDELIITVSRYITVNIRNNDMIYRLGGDEFLVVFPGINTEQAKTIWDRIEKEVEFFNKSGIKPYVISVSAGFAEYNKENCKKIDELIKEADNEMYKNKTLYKQQYNENYR